MSRVDSFSSMKESVDTKVSFKDLGQMWGGIAQGGLRSMKRENPKAKKVVIKGGPHQSSTVAAHTNVISCQLRTENEVYLGSAHIDEFGQVYPNKQWEKNKLKD